MSSSIVAVSSDERLLARLLGREGGVAGVGGQHGVQLRGDRAEAPEPLEEHLGRGRQLVERELPAVDARRGRSAARRRASRRAPRPRSRTSRAAARCWRSPRPVRKRSISSSGLIARLELAEHLQHDLVVEHDRGVGLLDAHRADVGAVASSGAGAVDRWKRKRPSSVSISVGGLDPAQQLARLSRLGERVVQPVHSSVLRDRRRRRGVRRRRCPGARSAAGRARACPLAKRAWTSASSSGGSSRSVTRSRRSRSRSRARDLEAYQRCSLDPVAQRLVVERASGSPPR